VSIQRSRLLALIEYLQHSVRSRAKVVSNVTDYGRFLLPEQQLAALDGVKLNDGGEDGASTAAAAISARRTAPLRPATPSRWAESMIRSRRPSDCLWTATWCNQWRIRTPPAAIVTATRSPIRRRGTE